MNQLGGQGLDTFACAPVGSRTRNLWLRRPTLYPIELQARFCTLSETESAPVRKIVTARAKKYLILRGKATFIGRFPYSGGEVASSPEGNVCEE
jgi:hypothetical protein